MELEITLPFLQQEEKPHGGRFGEGRRSWLNYKHQPVGGGVDAGFRGCKDWKTDEKVQ